MSNIVSNFNRWVKEEEWKNNSCCQAPNMKVVVYCCDCAHRPRKRWICGDEYEIAPPQDTDDRTCPFLRASYPWDNLIPDDKFFCAYGKRKE